MAQEGFDPWSRICSDGHAVFMSAFVNSLRFMSLVVTAESMCWIRGAALTANASNRLLSPFKILSPRKTRVMLISLRCFLKQLC